MGKITIIGSGTPEELEKMIEIAGMECPCQCVCGNWFELENGQRSENWDDNNLYCGWCKCHERIED